MHMAKTKELTLCGMFTAVVVIGTMAVSIPIPATNGFINLGDGVILTVAYLFGGWYACAAGAVGSALADILLGYMHWAPFTLIIKGLMGFAAVKLFNIQKSPFHFRNLFTIFCVEFIMVFGYYMCGALMYQSFAVSLESVPSNIIQAVGSACVFLVLGAGLGKVMKFKR